MPGTAISGGAARAAAVAWWLQRHQRLPPPAELLPRGLLDRAVELAQKTAAAAAPDLDPDLPCSLGPSSLPDLCDGLLACLADTNGSVSMAFKQFYQMVMPCDECGLSSSVISSWRYSWRPMEQAATHK